MKVSELETLLEVTCVTPKGDLTRKLSGVYVGDLLSVVMGKAKEDNVWVTIQGHVNIIAVASLINMACIIVTEGFDIDDETIERAIEQEVVVYKTSLSSYDVCAKLAAQGL